MLLLHEAKEGAGKGEGSQGGERNQGRKDWRKERLTCNIITLLLLSFIAGLYFSSASHQYSKHAQQIASTL